jgi:hypothetical protein
LDEGIAYMEKLSGYRAAFGGSHPGRGSRNALLKLGTRCYLEILAPDPEQTKLTWHMEIATLDQPLLIGWAAPAANLEHVAAELRKNGMACTGPTPGSRTKPNGEVLRWETVVFEDDKSGILPFYINWAEGSPLTHRPTPLARVSFVKPTIPVNSSKLPHQGAISIAYYFPMFLQPNSVSLSPGFSASSS